MLTQLTLTHQDRIIFYQALDKKDNPTTPTANTRKKSIVIWLSAMLESKPSQVNHTSHAKTEEKEHLLHAFVLIMYSKASSRNALRAETNFLDEFYYQK